MEELHHFAPQDEADKIRMQVENMGPSDSRGRPLGMVEGEGMKQLDKSMPVPVFT